MPPGTYFEVETDLGPREIDNPKQQSFWQRSRAHLSRHDESKIGQLRRPRPRAILFFAIHYPVPRGAIFAAEFFRVQENSPCFLSSSESSLFPRDYIQVCGFFDIQASLEI